MKKKILLLLLIICIYLSFYNDLENFYISNSKSEGSTTESKLAESQINSYESCCKNEKNLEKKLIKINEKVAKLEGENEALRNPEKK